MLTAASYEALSALLVKLFDQHELRLFIKIYYEDVIPSLPEQTSVFELAHAVVRRLDQRGYVDGRFFDHLRMTRPAAGQFISEISSVWNASGDTPRPQIQNQIVDTISQKIPQARFGWWSVIVVAACMLSVGQTLSSTNQETPLHLKADEEKVESPALTALAPSIEPAKPGEDLQFLKFQNAALSWAVQKRKAADKICRADTGKCARAIGQALDGLDERGTQAFLNGCQPSFETKPSPNAIALPHHGYIVLCPPKRSISPGGGSACHSKFSCFKLWIDCAGDYSCKSESGVGCVEGRCYLP